MFVIFSTVFVCSFPVAFSIFYTGAKDYCLGDGNSWCNKLEFSAGPLFSFKTLQTIPLYEEILCLKHFYEQTSFVGTLLRNNVFGVPWYIMFNKNDTCHTECTYELGSGFLEFLRELVVSGYRYQLFADNLPVQYCRENQFNSDRTCYNSIPVGCVSGDENCEPVGNSSSVMFFTHISFTVIYKETWSNDALHGNIVRIEAYPGKTPDLCKNRAIIIPEHISAYSDYTFTYGISFIKDNNRSLTERYSYVFNSNNDSPASQIATACLCVISLISLTMFVGYILFRIVRKSIFGYKGLLDDSNVLLDAHDEYGWKLIAGDVFRPPKHLLSLSITVGTGLHIFFMASFALLLANFDVYSPKRHETLTILLIVFYVVFSVLGGIISSGVYKFFGGTKWKMCILLSPVLHPCIIFAWVFSLNTILTISSFQSIKSSSLIKVFFIWLLASAPLNIIGGIVGFKWLHLHPPVKVNHIPRFIPGQSFKSKRIFNIIISGILPLGIIFINYKAILHSSWMYNNFYKFGFLLINSWVAVLIAAETTILLCYQHLSAEDYRWQWRSFFTSSSISIYLIIIVIHFYKQNHFFGMGAALIYFGYSFLAIYAVTLCFGSMGFLACLFLTSVMYASIKSD